MLDTIQYSVAAVVGVASVCYLWSVIRPKPKFKLEGPYVKFPLNLLNRLDALTAVLGIRLARVRCQEFERRAKELTALGDQRLFGDQEDFVEGMRAFLSSLDESIMPFSGILLLNGLLDRLLNTREQFVKYANNHVDVIQSSRLDKPFIISGLPRTGSTMLFNLMACDPATRAPRFYEMSQMASIAPPLGANDHDERQRRQQLVEQRFNEVERVYPGMFVEAGKSHRSHPSETEEELLVLFQTMLLQLHVPLPSATAAYREWFERSSHPAAYQYLRVFLQMLNSTHQPSSHWVLKAPIHSFYLDDLFRAFPDARFVFTARDPLAVVPSWATLIESYLAWSYRRFGIDRIEMGRYIMESLRMMADRVSDFQAKVPADRYFNVNYEVFVKNPIAMVESIYQHFGLTVSDEFREAMEQWIRDNRQGKWGRAPYSITNYNITKDQVLSTFANYSKQFLAK